MTGSLASVCDPVPFRPSATEAAHAPGVMQAEPRAVVREDAVPFPSSRAERHRATRDAMVACAAMGLTRRETAARLGVTPSAISKAIRSHGFVFAPARRRKIAP